MTTCTKDLLEIVHSDVCGPMSAKSYGGARYFVSFIDDKTHMIFVYTIATKDETLTKFKEFWSLVEKQTGKHIKMLHSDNGREYTSHTFEASLKNCGIQHQKSAPYVP